MESMQREDAKRYLGDVIARAANEAMRAMADVIAREQFTRQDAELLQNDLLPNARWAAQEVAYTPLRLWEVDMVAYAKAFMKAAATMVATAQANKR